MPQPTSHTYPKTRKRPRKLGMTQKDAASHLGVSAFTVQKRIHQGEIRTLADGSIDPAQFSDLMSPAASDAMSTAPENSREHWETKLAEAKARNAWLEYEKSAENLVEKDVVTDQYFDILRRTRDRLLAVPDRVAPIVAGISDARRCRDILLREQRDALEMLATELEVLADAEESASA